MKPIRRAGVAAGAALAGLLPALAQAGGSKGGGANCGCTAPPPPCNCTVPNGHEITVPGVNITAPSITVISPNINVTGANVEVQASSVAEAQASSSASANAASNAYANGSSNASALASGLASAQGYANGLAAANAFGVAVGGGSGFSSAVGVGQSFAPALQVVSETAETQRVCTEFRAVAKVVAVQAVCLDDKAVPHPASQVLPDRDVLPVYEGELFRCIAGTHMQYTLGLFSGSADFSHGQTVSCVKGEALYHSAAGGLACRPQRPARDCNERSLLRRYGAGIKVLRIAAQRECVAYGTETAQGPAATSGEALQLDGGVGGTY